MLHDRAEAGRLLAERLAMYRGQDVVVLGLPRGGVIVAAQIARALDAPLGALLVRKLGAPYRPELAIGAIAAFGETTEVVLSHEVIAAVSASDEYIEAETRAQLGAMRRRAARYHLEPAAPITDRVVIVVDDGVATGATVAAALTALVRQRPARCVLAVPVAATQALDRLRRQVDDVVCLHETPRFRAVGAFYVSFGQVPDEEVIALLEQPTPARDDGEA